MEPKELEKMLKALANHRRILILRYLKEKKEATVGDIAHAIKLSFKSTSRHLSVLASRGILENDQRSTQIFYHIAPNLPEPLCKFISLVI